MNLVDRAKNIIMTPKTEWPVIAQEQPNIGQIMTGYVIPLALIPFIAEIIGWGLIAGSFTWGIVTAVIGIIASVVGVYVTAYVIDFLAPNFNSERSLGRAVQLVAYSYTPGWVAGILHIIPGLSWLATILSLYGLYLLYLGFPHMMKTPQDKVVVYLIVAVIVLIVIYMIIGASLSAILLGLFGFGAMRGAYY